MPRLPPVPPARSSRATGTSTVAGTTRSAGHVQSLTTLMAVPCRPIRCATVGSTRWLTLYSCSFAIDGDLVSWIDRQFQDADDPASPNRLPRLREALVGPLREVYGVSDKVLTMTLSCILLAAPKRLHRWQQAGASMIAIDTLVHNFLVRTGILARFDADHSYGAACYRAGGCADIIAAVAARIDARQFNPGFPRLFPRFVQHAIWRYCDLHTTILDRQAAIVSRAGRTPKVATASAFGCLMPT